jgi:hypothetical protein
MDFLDPKKKRAHRIRLMVGYLLIAIIIGLGTMILIFQSYGYDLDHKTGNIIQNGLIFVSAQPEQASIYLNNKLYKTNNGARLVLPTDNYTLELKRPGYRTWKKVFTLAGGTIERFVYPFLFPEKLITTDRQLYTATPQFASQSPDKHWMVVLQPGKIDGFDAFDANNPKAQPTSFTLPAGLLTASNKHVLQLVEWSTDNRHLLVDHQYEGGHEFVVIDRDTPASSVNLNKTFQRNPTEVTLRNKDYDRYYFFDKTAQTLDSATLKDASVVASQQNVLSYKSHGNDMVLWTTSKDANPGKARVMISDKDGSYVVREVAAGDVYLLDLAQFDGAWYVLAGAPADNKVTVYKNPLDKLKGQSTTPLIPAAVLRVDNPTYVSFSDNTRFMIAQSGNKFAVFDAENNRSFRYAIQAPIDGGLHVNWMDGHRMYYTSNNQLVVFDFDGTNAQLLNNSTADHKVFFDRDYLVMYNVAPSVAVQNRAALTVTNLKANQ